MNWFLIGLGAIAFFALAPLKLIAGVALFATLFVLFYLLICKDI